MEYRKLSIECVGLYCIIGVLSVLVFIGIYGTNIINPSYISWLFDGGELSQHYLGWVAYRESSWHFPIGMVDKLAYPNLTSVIFTDSIPLFAVLFKVLSPVLPTNFQYMGLWGIMCFVLHSIFAARVLKRYTDNKLALVLASLLCLISPIVLFRMYGHTALAGQWIIVYGLGLIFNCESQQNKKIFFQTAVLALLASSVHIYILLMCGIVIIGICISDFLLNKKFLRVLGILADFLFVSAIVIWLLGGFSSGMDAQNAGLGVYSFNLNGFFNPQGWSCLLNDLPQYDGQYEGFAYLGAGFIILLVIDIFVLIKRRITGERLYLKYNVSISLLVVFVISLIVSLSPVVTIGTKILLNMRLPEFVTNIWSIFRASGRIIWVDVYIIEMAILIIFIRSLGKKEILLAALSIALALQLFDLHNKLTERYEHLSPITEYPSPLSTKEFWDTVSSDGNIKHVMYFKAPDRYYMYRITEWAIDNEMTVNNYYFPRSIDEEIKTGLDAALEALREDCIFIFPESCKMYCVKYPLHYYRVDGLIIGYVNKIPGFEELSDSEFELYWAFADNMYIMPESGKDTESGREIYPGGFSFGPYWSLPSGSYSITITGVNLADEVEVNIQSISGTNKHEFHISDQTAETITLAVSFDTDVDDLEIVIKNNSDKSLIVNSVLLKCIG